MARLFTPKIASLYEDFYRAKGVKFVKGTVLTSFEFDSNKKVRYFIWLEIQLERCLVLCIYA